MGVRYQGRHAGTFGDIGVLSFNGNKLLTAGGGGAVLTQGRASAEYARYLITQARNDEPEHIHREVGYNYRLSSLQAALGVAQLECIALFIAKKRAIAKTYHEAFQGLDGLTLMPTPPQTEATYWIYTFLLPPGTTAAQRKAFVRQLKEQGISARSFWHPLYALPPYRDCQAFRIEHAMDLYERSVSLPSSAGLSADEMQRCITAVKETLVSGRYMSTR